MTLQSIGSAMGVAAMRWAIVYLVVTHLFVLWKWDSYSVSPRSQAALLQQQKQQSATLHTAKTAEEWTQQLSATRSAVSSLEADTSLLKTKQAELDERKQRMNHSLELLRRKQVQLETLQRTWAELSVAEEDLVIFQDGPRLPEKDDSFAPLQRLLRVADLAEYDEIDELHAAFAAAMNALQVYIERTGETPSWAAVKDVLSNEAYPTKVSQISSCPEILPSAGIEQEEGDELPPSTNDDDPETSNFDASVALTEADVQERLDEIRRHWDALYEGDRTLPVSDGQLKHLESIRQTLVEEWLQRVQHALDESLDKVELALTQGVSDDDMEEESTGTEDLNCAQLDDIHSILEAGIEAVHRRSDMRDALGRAMVDRDPQLSNVILDADLPMGEETLPPISRPETLRQYLDSALVAHEVPVWIHAVLDAAGGYSDALDSFLDSLPDNAGDAAVHHLLDLAGQVNLSALTGKVQL